MGIMQSRVVGEMGVMSHMGWESYEMSKWIFYPLHISHVQCLSNISGLLMFGIMIDVQCLTKGFQCLVSFNWLVCSKGNKLFKNAGNSGYIVQHV